MNTGFRTQSAPLDVNLRRLEWFLDFGEQAGSWPTELLRLLPYGAVYALLHGALVATGFALSTVPEEAVAVWPAIGLLCAILTATPRRSWPVWITFSIIGRVLVEVATIDGRGWVEPIIFSSVNAVEAVIFAVFTQRPLIQVYRFGRPLYLSGTLLIMAITAANVGGLLGAVVLQRLYVDSSDFWQLWRVWAAGDFVGIILIAPLALWQMLPQIRIRHGRARWPELVAMPVTLLAILALSIYLRPGKTFDLGETMRLSLGILVAFPVLWAAVRAEFRFTAVMLVLLAVAVIVTASHGLGPFGHTAENYLDALIAMQLFMVITVLVVTIVSSAVLEQERAKSETSLHQQFSDLLVQLTDKLIGAKPQSLDEVINDSLQMLARFAGADRCVLLQMDAAGLQVSATHSWNSAAIGELPAEVAHANLAELPWALRQIREHGYIAVRGLDRGLTGEAQELEPIRKATPQTVDALYIGLFDEGRIIGFIGYSYVSHVVHWRSESVSLMYLIGQMFANILQRQKAQQDLEAYRDRLRSLAVDMTITEERARRRTADDLHDGIGQNLAVARMKLGQALARDDIHSEELVQARNLIDDALRGTRFIIADLSPSILYELGLLPALQSLAERFEPANNIACTVEESGIPWSPDNDLGITLYRAVQECLNNVARHAQAVAVVVRVLWSADKLDIEVQDNGIGFDADEVAIGTRRAAGFGLFSMRENLELIGGELVIESTRGLGTTVRLCTPRLEAEDEQ